jgi:PST family polysaccharide transporter
VTGVDTIDPHEQHPGIPSSPTGAAVADDAERRRLDHSLLHGIAWTGGARWIGQILSWLSTFVVARILTPADYGIVSMAVVVSSLVGPMAEFGIGTAIVQRRRLTEDDIAQLGGWLALFGVGASCLIVALAGWVSHLFKEPAVRGVLTVYGAVLLVSALRAFPVSLLLRDLRFKTVAQINAIEAVTSIGTVLALAVSGLGYWALVGGYSAGQLASATAAWIVRRPTLRRPRNAALAKDILTFGFRLTGAKLAGLTYSQADFAVVGRVLGSALLGAYTLGWQLASMPVERIGWILTDVASPLFASIQHDHKALSRYVLRMSEGLALITFPLTIGLALVADHFVAVALGPKWANAVLPLRILSCYAGFRSLDTLIKAVLISTGRVDRLMRYSLQAVVVLIPLFYLGARYMGLGGVAAAWVVGLPVAAVIPAFRTVAAQLGFTFREYVVAIRSAIEATVTMALVVLAVRVLLPADWHPLPLLLAEVTAGAATYFAVLRTRHWDRMLAFWTLARALLSRRAPGSAPPSITPLATTL